MRSSAGSAETRCVKKVTPRGILRSQSRWRRWAALVATRSIGQFSTLYGAIEDMVVGLEAVLADGTVTRIKNVPRRAAGPDIRHIIIGNEGALCYITEVTVKIFKFTPENNLFYGYIWKT